MPTLEHAVHAMFKSVSYYIFPCNKRQRVPVPSVECIAETQTVSQREITAAC